MLFISILHHYLLWHYTRAWREILHVWRNFFWFTLNFFSIPQLLHSLLLPFKRMTEPRGESFNFADLASFIIINLISLLIGFVMRLAVIFLGLITFIILAVGLVMTYLFWAVAPALIFVCLGYGLVFLFK